MPSQGLRARRNIRHAAAAWLGVLALVLQTYFPLAVTAIAAHLAMPDAMLLCATAADEDGAAASADGNASGKPAAPPAGHVHHHCPGCLIHGAGGSSGGKALAAAAAVPPLPVRSATVRFVPAEPTSAPRQAPAAFYSPRGPPSSLRLISI